jgi:hypothetical protein
MMQMFISFMLLSILRFGTCYLEYYFLKHMMLSNAYSVIILAAKQAFHGHISNII